LSEHQRGRPSAPGLGVTWGGQPNVAARALTVAAASVMAFGFVGPVAAQAATSSSAADVSVIVRELSGSGNGPEHAVEALGGTVGEHLGLIDGFSATVPADRVSILRTAAGVHSVTEDAALTLTSAAVDEANALPGSLSNVATITGATAMWDAGFTGKGVDVAVIDSGISPVDGLRTPGKVVYGPDLSFDSKVCSWTGCKDGPAKNLDLYGHGTHMAGIIAGRDDAASATVTSAETGNFVGMAPDARIVSIKVADGMGRTDVSQAIAAIDWVVQNRSSNGLNIRVLNLSFGTDGVQDYVLDPLTYAAEVAWHNGVVVVVAAGNDGAKGKLANPAYDPYVLAVGGSDANGTRTTADDVIPAWSNTGDGTRNPDVVAPGKSVVSLRTPGSNLDANNLGARTGDRFFRGSGTSQAAAVVSGAAALLLSQRPDMTPDQVKALLTGTAQQLPAADAVAQGNGTIDLEVARDTATPAAVTQNWVKATGLGSLEAARGSVHVTVNGKTVTGEQDVRGHRWDAAKYTAGARNRTNWNGITWSGITWSGITWSGITWSGITWSGITWSGITWSGITWSGITWSGITWSGITWSGITWSGITWSGADWV
jgi:serine protease AprX